MKPGSKLSADGEGQSGFNNDRDGLFISPAQMEKYFEAADTAIIQLIALRAKPVDIRLEAEKMFMTEQNSPPTKKLDTQINTRTRSPRCRNSATP